MTTQFQIRSKCTAALNAEGDIVPGEPVANFKGLPSDPFFYVLESGAGAWEYGRCDLSASTGSQREVHEYSGESGFASGTTSLTLTVVASPMNFASVGASGAYPRARGAYSTAVGGSANAYLTGATAVGGIANAQGLCATAIGNEASASEVDTGYVTALGARAQAQLPSSTAVGSRAKTSCPGETVFGHTEASHVAFIPLLAEADLTAGGTFTLQAVANQAGPGGEVLAPITSLPEPSSDAYCAYVHRVRLSIYARGYVEPDNYRVFATAEYIVLEAAVTTISTPTIVVETPVSSGVSFAINSSGIPTVTVPVGFEGKVAGHMLIERVAVPA